jgi:phage terminase small subunit
MRKNPLLIVLRSASEQIRANAQQLGATPLARARMPEPEHEQMSLADILFADAVTGNE